MKHENPDFFTRAHNIPCGIVIEHSYRVLPYRGPIALCPSDLDWYGYSDLEYHLTDRRGYRADWLDSILTPAERTKLEDEIRAHLDADRESARVERAEYLLEDR